MIKELICIICPMGCHLQIEMDDMKNINLVTGNSCPRGEKYACKELIHPERILTSTVRIEGAIHPMLPVMTDKAVAKDKMFDVMKKLKEVRIKAPVKYEDIIIENNPIKNEFKTDENILFEITLNMKNYNIKVRRSL